VVVIYCQKKPVVVSFSKDEDIFRYSYNVDGTKDDDHNEECDNYGIVSVHYSPRTADLVASFTLSLYQDEVQAIFPFLEFPLGKVEI